MKKKIFGAALLALSLTILLVLSTSCNKGGQDVKKEIGRIDFD